MVNYWPFTVIFCSFGMLNTYSYDYDNYVIFSINSTHLSNLYLCCIKWMNVEITSYYSLIRMIERFNQKDMIMFVFPLFGCKSICYSIMQIVYILFNFWIYRWLSRIHCHPYKALRFPEIEGMPNSSSLI